MRKSFEYGILPVIAVFGLVTVALLLVLGCSDDDVSGPTGGSQTFSWMPEDIIPEGHHWNAVYFANASDGWMVGRTGAIIHTNDGGKSWTPQFSGTINHLHDIVAVSADNAWIVGDNGTILRTDNGGLNWDQAIVTGTKKNLMSVEVVNDSSLWAVGLDGSIVYTITSGFYWESKSQGAPTQSFSTIAFDDSATAIVVGAGGTILAATMDTAGNWADWTAQTSNISEQLNAVTMVNSMNAWAVGNGGQILKTIDGGTQWNTYDDTAITSDLVDVFFTDDVNGWVVGANGLILATTDGGNTWSKDTTAITNHDLTSVVFTDGANGWIVGQYVILSTSDQGTTWTSFLSGTLELPTLKMIQFIDDSIGWAVGHAGTIIRTTNGGLNWDNLYKKGDIWFNDVDFVDSLNGWAAGGSGIPPYRAIILRTVDGGLNWTFPDTMIGLVDTIACKVEVDSIQDITYKIKSEIDTTWITALDMVTDSSGWAVGGKRTLDHGGVVFRTWDGGQSWINIPIVTDTTWKMVDSSNAPCYSSSSIGDTVIASISSMISKLTGLSVVSMKEGWACGSYGSIWHMYEANPGDLDLSWELQSFDLDSSYHLEDIEFVDNQTGWAVGRSIESGGNGGVILHTSDGGVNWSNPPTLTDAKLMDIEFVGPDTGWIVGDKGTVLYTVDGGAVWVTQPTPTHNTLLGITILDDPSIGWIVGEQGLLLRTTTGGTK